MPLAGLIPRWRSIGRGDSSAAWDRAVRHYACSRIVAVFHRRLMIGRSPSISAKKIGASRSSGIDCDPAAAHSLLGGTCTGRDARCRQAGVAIPRAGSRILYAFLVGRQQQRQRVRGMSPPPRRFYNTALGIVMLVRPLLARDPGPGARGASPRPKSVPPST